MQKLLTIITFFIGIFFLINNVSAASYTARAYINSSGNVRKGPGTQYGIVEGREKEGTYYLLVEDKLHADTNNHKDCIGDWYQVYYNGTSTGYICEDHVDVVYSHTTDDIAPSTTCEQKMSDAGFPSSYWGGLCAMQERHPNWQFFPLKINYDWQFIVDKESSCGVNLIYGSDENKGFIDPTCTAYESGYVGITQTGVAYYMDPRNFLSDRHVFQFEALSYDQNFSSIYSNAVTNIISGAEFYKYHLNKNTNLTDIIVTSGATHNVSPIFTSARILQELGSGTTLYNLYSGEYTGYENIYYGYYNFFNFGVSDSCVQNYGTTYCGLEYARKKAWNSVHAAINGGISQIANSYIANNQNTGYLQKFNVNQSNTSSIATHQYMTNIAAPSSESATSYKAYKKIGILDSAFIFYIPVYNNMNVTITNTPGGAVDTPDESKPSALPISTIVTSSGYKYASGYISGIALGSDVSTLKTNLEAVGGSSTVTIYNSAGEIVNSGQLATGYKVVINNSSTVETLEVIIKGDTSGDGVINALDLLQVQKNILGTYSLTGAYALAGDTSGDGVINALDLLQVQKSILGTYTIVQ